MKELCRAREFLRFDENLLSKIETWESVVSITVALNDDCGDRSFLCPLGSARVVCTQ